jgi:hypothetical protein
MKNKKTNIWDLNAHPNGKHEQNVHDGFLGKNSNDVLFFFLLLAAATAAGALVLLSPYRRHVTLNFM